MRRIKAKFKRGDKAWMVDYEAVKCPACGQDIDGQYEYVVKPVEIYSVNAGDEAVYIALDNNGYSADDLFATEVEAQAEADKKNKE